MLADNALFARELARQQNIKQADDRLKFHASQPSNKQQQNIRQADDRLKFHAHTPRATTPAPAPTPVPRVGGGGSGGGGGGGTSFRLPEVDRDGILGNLQNILTQTAAFPYQEQLNALLSGRPAHTPLAWEEILRRGQDFAALEFDPQVSALHRTLEQQRLAAAGQKQMIDATYAGMPERTARLLETARAQALESAIARGAGRSGVVEWLTDRQQAPIFEHMQQQEAERTARLSDVINQLALFETQGGSRLQELEALRGRTALQQAQAIQDLEFARSTENWQMAFDAMSRLSGLATDAQTRAQEIAMGLLPYKLPTYAEEAAIRAGIAGLFGQAF